MKKTLQFILAFVIGLGMFIMPITAAKAEEKTEKSVSDTTFRIWNHKQGTPSGHWGEFKFRDMGDGTVRFRPANGEAGEMSTRLRLGHPYTVKFYDNEGNVYYSKEFASGYYVRDFAQEVGSVKMRYGLDSFQITYTSNVYRLSLLGPVHANFESSDFYNLYKDTARKYSFRVERDGLYAERRDIQQAKIADGEYIIETAQNSDNVMSAITDFSIDPFNIGAVALEANKPAYQKFKLTYDNLNKAYKITTAYGRVLTAAIDNGGNIISKDDRNEANQFWYLQSVGSDKYRLVNARDTSRSADLTKDGNISLYKTGNGINQQFKFVKYADKPNIDKFSGEWKIAIRLNHDQVFDVNNILTCNNVTLGKNNNGNTQKWIFNYDDKTNSYIINNKADGKALAWNSNYNRNVFMYPTNLSGDDARWILEPLGDGYYIFKNYKNQNLVLNIDTNSNISVTEFRNNGNQQFKLIK